MHGRAKPFGELIMASGPTIRAVGRFKEEEEEEIAVLPISIPDSDGLF